MLLFVQILAVPTLFMSQSHVPEGFSKLVYFHILSTEGPFLFESDEMHGKSA